MKHQFKEVKVEKKKKIIPVGVIKNLKLPKFD